MIGILGVFAFGISGKFEGFSLFKEELVKEETVKLDENIKNILIEGTSHGVELKKSEDENIKISQYGNKNNLFTIKNEDGTFHIHVEDKISFFTLGFNKRKLTIEIPESYNGNLDAKTIAGGILIESKFILNNINLESTSGGVQTLNDLLTKSFRAHTVSGGIKIESDLIVTNNITDEFENDFDMTKNIIDLKSTSGGIKTAGNVMADNIIARTVSGGIDFNNVDVKNYDLQSTSGGIKIESISGEGNAKTTSGGIDIFLKKPQEQVQLETTSGGIRLKLENSLQFTLEANTTSGGINTNFATETSNRNSATAKIGENPTVNIIAKASSGGIKIEN